MGALDIIKGLRLTKSKEYRPIITSTGLVEPAGSRRQREETVTGKLYKLDFIARFSKDRLDLTVRNPERASHKGGFWDLGDKNSVFFKDLSLRIENKSPICYKLKREHGKGKYKKAESVTIYQDSSGNKNWLSKNHVNRDNVVMNSFKGYKVYEGKKEVAKGDHAQPTIKASVTVSVKDFWQNFPKAIEADDQEIIIRLWPYQYKDLHELQPGEQKTHTIFFGEAAEGKDLAPKIKRRKSKDARFQKIIRQLDLDKNLIPDEFGWRHFGDIYADHEEVDISHYNNQYDVINGALNQFHITSDKKWFFLADGMARHVRDIDIYHTKKDRAAYNGGMFWHTFHYMDAATCTHRGYSIRGRSTMAKFNYGAGGGPSNEHCYTTGLKNHYLLTEDIQSKEAVIGLANWIISMDDGKRSILRFLNQNPTGKASQSESVYYHGPGRGSGNSICCLLDAYELTNNKVYLKKAEELIRRCIHPYDNIAKHHLSDIEHRWFYLVFLQVLGKYLDLKGSAQMHDYMFYYAKDSLLHYAGWMLKHEHPYKDMIDKVDIPSQTWYAQDIRKVVVLSYAYKYSGDTSFSKKAKFFQGRCLKDVTECTTRVIAILMNYVEDIQDSVITYPKRQFRYGKPRSFKPQGYYLFKLRDLVRRFV